MTKEVQMFVGPDGHINIKLEGPPKTYRKFPEGTTIENIITAFIDKGNYVTGNSRDDFIIIEKIKNAPDFAKLNYAKFSVFSDAGELITASVSLHEDEFQALLRGAISDKEKDEMCESYLVYLLKGVIS